MRRLIYPTLLLLVIRPPSASYRYGVRAVQNVTFQNTRSELVYTPELCNATVDEDGCTGAWMVVDLPGSSNGSVSTTTGPSAQYAYILPQMFFTFQGSALYIKTSDTSNATANLTVSMQPSGTLFERVFSPSVDFWSFTDLDESQATTCVVTFSPEPAADTEFPAHLDIDFVKISVSNASASSVYLPSQTISSPTFTPSFASFTTPSSSAGTIESSVRHSTKDIVGGVLGGFFALLICSLAAFLIRHWRRRRLEKQRKERTMRAQAAQQVAAAGPARRQPPMRWQGPSSSLAQIPYSAIVEVDR
ncbi:hypothetical protein M0805_003981 [Coniferiporia weirii]|nr:hypothetical protein M0805_003981 [Coniferiporia weirii]